MKKIIKNVLVFLLYFVYIKVYLFLMEKAGMPLTNFSLPTRVIILFTLNIVFIAFLFILYKDELKTDFKDFKKNWKKYLKKYVNYYMIGLILMAISNIVLQHLLSIKISGNEEAVEDLIKIVPFYMLFQSVIYAPFVEEMIFRKVIRNVISNGKLFVIISGVVFGVVHISDFSDYKQILMGIPYIIMGLDFAYIYYKSKNIYTTMTLHFAHNAILYSIQIIGGLL